MGSGRKRIPPTSASRSAGTKMLEFLSWRGKGTITPLTNEEQSAITYKKLEWHLKPGMLDRICLYAKTADDLRAIFKVFTPVLGFRSTEVGATLSEKDRNAQLQKTFTRTFPAWSVVWFGGRELASLPFFLWRLIWKDILVCFPCCLCCGSNHPSWDLVEVMLSHLLVSKCKGLLCGERDPNFLPLWAVIIATMTKKHLARKNWMICTMSLSRAQKLLRIIQTQTF